MEDFATGESGRGGCDGIPCGPSLAPVWPSGRKRSKRNKAADGCDGRESQPGDAEVIIGRRSAACERPGRGNETRGLDTAGGG